MNKIFNGETHKETSYIITLAMKTKTKFSCYVAGTIFGMANTLSSFGGFLSSYIVGKLTNNNVSKNAFNIKNTVTYKINNLYFVNLYNAYNYCTRTLKF